MFCHHSSTSDSTPDSKPANGATPLPSEGSISNRSRLFSSLAVAGALIAPHSLCILGAVGLGGAASWFGIKLCSGSTCPPDSVGVDADPGDKLPLARLVTIPKTYTMIDEALQDKIVAALFDKLPLFYEVLSYKQNQADGEGEVQFVTVLDSDGNLIAGLCREGMMCPCSKPEFFVVGNISADDQQESFPGQNEILGLVKNSTH